MGIDNQLVIGKMFPNILKVIMEADDKAIKLLRDEVIGVLDEIGPKRFVNMTAEILKKDFSAEGCDDARIPLKRLFSMSVEEAKAAVLLKDYGLLEGHPISVLLQEHRSGMARLEKFDSVLEKVKKGIFNKSILAGLKEVNIYFSELDSHIRKEEEALFPVLEEHGMKEHPDTLKEEHKRFREIIKEMIEAIDKLKPKQFLVSYREISRLGGEFVPAMSNHIFRETYIFYPAALEFVEEESEWNQIKDRFSTIR